MKTMLRYLAGCFVGLFLLAGCASPGHHGGAWEYKVIEEFNYTGKLEPELNELGKEGWTVVSASATIGPGAANSLTQVILKRRLHH